MSSVDVIIPCYKYGDFLKECVGSVLDQSGVHVRVLIIDDASPDGTADIASGFARSHPNVTFWRHTINKGHIATYNEGIDWASADYMLLLSADDYLAPDALKRAVALMDRHPEVDFIFGKIAQLNPDGHATEIHPFVDAYENRGDRILSTSDFFAYISRGNIVPTPTALVRTSAQKRAGGYNSKLPHTADMEMWLRLGAQASVGFVDQIQAVYRVHTTNMSRVFVDDKRLLINQRKVAFDTFFSNYGESLPEQERLEAQVYRLLASQVLAHASWAFNDGELELSSELAQFALEINPRARLTLPWAKLSFKTAVGHRNWNAIRCSQMAIREWVG